MISIYNSFYTVIVFIINNTVWTLIEFNIFKTPSSLCLLLNFHWCFTFPSLYPWFQEMEPVATEIRKTHSLTVPHAWATLAPPAYLLPISSGFLTFSSILATFSTPSPFLVASYISSLSFSKLPYHLPIKSEFQWWQWQSWWVNSFLATLMLCCLEYLPGSSQCHHHIWYYWYPFYKNRNLRLREVILWRLYN